MAAEARTHPFAFDALEALPYKNRKGVYVPQIYRTIAPSRGGRFVIMDFIHGRTLRELYRSDESSRINFEPYYNQIARGLKLIY